MQRAVRAGLVAGADHRATSVTVSAQLRRMVQEAAAGATSTTEFFHRLQASGAEVELRMSTKNEGQVTGYKVRPDGIGLIAGLGCQAVVEVGTVGIGTDPRHCAVLDSGRRS